MTVSIALCTYNGAGFIRKQIDSYLDQTILPDEIVVCDDGSGDETLTIIRQFIGANPGIQWRLVQQKTNLGASRNFEKAISLCEGDLIFLSDQDDIWEKEKLEESLIFFKKNPDCAASFSNASLIDENDRQLSGTLLDHSFFKPHVRKEYTKDDLLYWSLLFGNMMTGATMAIRRKALSTVLPFHLQPGRKLWHDGWIGFSLMASNQVGYIDRNLIRYRIHAAQQVGVVIREDPFERHVMLGEYRKDQTKEYFQRYLAAFAALQGLKKIRPVATAVEKRISGEYIRQRKEYFKSQSFLAKKARLLKWYLKGINYISFRDLVSL